MSVADDQMREKLRRIRTFAQLFSFLRDELEWPIEADDFEDTYFEYTPEELGLDESSTAAIDHIRRLRPLTTNQPWGVYFVEFERKRLPVVALRRILSSVVLKKRASANDAERAAWAQDDLLFISAYGDGEARHIAFAHFTDPADGERLPVLRVLGWDNSDTALHLDGVAETLRGQLSWPEDEVDTDSWRSQWRSAFSLSHREVITTSRDLAEHLAGVAQEIRDRIASVLEVESGDGPLRRLMEAFRASLLADLSDMDFADMYAQTIAYGLLSARIADPTSSPHSLASLVPLGNPFLTELMQTFVATASSKKNGTGRDGFDFDELGVNDVVDLLERANIDAVLRDFGDRNPLEDPVIHFYEHFLREYDPRRRMERGVFYTPVPVVSFIVRAIDDVLRREFGLEDGLAATTTWGELAKRVPGLEIPDSVDPTAPFVQVLDPAVGTGTFLVEAIDVIYQTMTRRWLQSGMHAAEIHDAWNDYVPAHLLPRLHGYELLMAPYAIAHLKIGLKLHETGYSFHREERTRIYLTNALEPPVDDTGRLASMAPALAHEAAAVALVKRGVHFTVVLGNPPYAKNSANRSTEAERLVKPYKELVLGERNVQPLSDDYVKFLALASAVSNDGPAVVGMITNHSYFSGLIHRGMRQILSARYEHVSVVDLHGDTNVGEEAPSGMRNENVFDITQGVGISLLVHTFAEADKGDHRVRRADIWGSRSEKFESLGLGIDALQWADASPEQPYFFFNLREIVAADDDWPSLDEIFEVKGMGIKSRRDHFLVSMRRDALVERFERIADAAEVESLRSDLQVTDNAQWSLQAMRSLVRREGVEACIRPINYRPFDRRWIWYHREAIERGDARWPVMRNLEDTDLCLLSSRQTANARFNSALVVRGLSEMKTAESSRGSYAFPLVRRGEGMMAADITDNIRRERFGAALVARPPDEILAYIYAILNSPSYRVRYEELLRIEFPRIPTDPVRELADQLVDLGQELISCHLLEAELPAGARTVGLDRDDAPEVERVTYCDETVWLDRKMTRGFGPISQAAWDLEIGGYQVLDKWLKSHQPRGAHAGASPTLTLPEVEHLLRVAASMEMTVALQVKIDEVIDHHGGWPKAFGRTPGDVSNVGGTRSGE